MPIQGCMAVGAARKIWSWILLSSADTLLQVEDKLLTEYALETSLEGNRFHDLMRVARYRNDPSWLADKVAAKFPEGEREAIRAKLLNRQNWYLPTTVELGEK